MTEISLIHGDCIKEMSQIASPVDCIITSPPYMAGKEYEEARSSHDYMEFAKQWIDSAATTMSPTGQMWINLGYAMAGSNQAIPLTYMYYALIPDTLHMIQEIVWHYEGGMSYKRRFSHRTERWMWLAKDPANITFNLDSVRDRAATKHIKDKRCNPLGKNPTDLWYFNRVAGNSKEKVGHPCQFPVSMIERIVLACTNQGDVVLDPFSGSGSTAIACIKHGRRFIGIEKSEEYVSMAQSRIAQEIS